MIPMRRKELVMCSGMMEMVYDTAINVNSFRQEANSPRNCQVPLIWAYISRLDVYPD